MRREALARLLLQLPDELLAALYAGWDGDKYDAVGMGGGEPGFTCFLLDGDRENLDDYTREGVSQIRRALREAIER